MSLEKDKEYLKRDVDTDTKRLILLGFTFDGVTLPLDADSRADYIGLKTLEDSMTWPVMLPTLSGGYYSLLQVDLDAFLAAGLSVYRGYRESGRLLKQELDAATNQFELESIDLYRT